MLVCVGRPTRPGRDAARRLPLRTTPLPGGPSCPSHRAALPLVSVDSIRHPNSGKGPGGRATPDSGYRPHPQPQPCSGASVAHCMDHPLRFRVQASPTHPNPLGASVALHGPPLRFGGAGLTHPPQPSQGCPLELPPHSSVCPCTRPRLGHPLPDPLLPSGHWAPQQQPWSMEHPPCAQTSLLTLFQGLEEATRAGPWPPRPCSL